MVTLNETFKKAVLDGMSAGLSIAEQTMREDNTITPSEEQAEIMREAIAILEENGYARNEEGRYVKTT